MKKAIDVPPELAHLLEKRDSGDRRKPADSNRDAHPSAAGDSTATGGKPRTDRRRGQRRKSP